MRLVVAAGLALTWVTAAAMGQSRSDGDRDMAGRPHTPPTLKYLNERIGEVTFQEAPLDQVFDWLAQLTPMNIVVRWQVLDDVGVERDKPISLSVRNLRLAQVLWLILNEAGGPDLKLAYWASGELLIVSTDEDLSRDMIVVVYPVSDLLLRIPQFDNSPHVDVSSNAGGGQGDSQGVFQSSGGGQTAEEGTQRERGTKTDVDELIHLIVTSVEPDSWTQHGGRGTIQAFRDLLVVRNSALVHEALAGYVDAEAQ